MQCYCWDADCKVHIPCSNCMLMQSLCQRPDALLCVQPVLILENEDAVAEVLQLSSVPIPGGHLQPSLLVCLLLICHEVRLQQSFHTCCHSGSAPVLLIPAGSLHQTTGLPARLHAHFGLLLLIALKPLRMLLQKIPPQTSVKAKSGPCVRRYRPEQHTARHGSRARVQQ